MPARNLVVVHRSHTELGQDVPPWEIGTLLWLILDAAGETNIGDPPLLAQTAGTRLTAETLRQVLEASTFSVTISGVVSLTFDPDQTLSASQNGTLLVKGRWWVEGDLCCFDLGAECGGRQCSQLVLNGNQLTFFDLDGYATMRATVTRP